MLAALARIIIILMKLWTIQTPDVWQTLQSQGVYRATEQGIPDESFEKPYRWMIQQLAQHVQRPAKCYWPIWAWHQWEDRGKRKPDLRASSHLEKGKTGVRMEIEVDEAKVLLSDFDLWHYVLNYWYLPTTEKEGEDFEAEVKRHGLSFYETKPLPFPYHNRIENSWKKIFDLDWSAKDISCKRDHKSIQAVFWELRVDQVKNVDVFTAR